MQGLPRESLGTFKSRLFLGPKAPSTVVVLLALLVEQKNALVAPRAFAKVVGHTQAAAAGTADKDVCLFQNGFDFSWANCTYENIFGCTLFASTIEKWNILLEILNFNNI